jgi:hypothetical protein
LLRQLAQIEDVAGILADCNDFRLATFSTESAQSGGCRDAPIRSLLEEKRTSQIGAVTSVFDPKRSGPSAATLAADSTAGKVKRGQQAAFPIEDELERAGFSFSE